MQNKAFGGRETDAGCTVLTISLKCPESYDTALHTQQASGI